MINKISVTYDSERIKNSASDFALLHKLACCSLLQVTTPMAINFTEDFIELRDVDKNIAINVDFLSGTLAHRQRYGLSRAQTIAKAVGIKQGKTAPSVLDATAGLAKDAFVLASLGCPVTMIERSFIIVELVKDAIRRAEQSSSFQDMIKNGFAIKHADSIKYLQNLSNKTQVSIPDVIFLDPMYPERKKSAAVKKNMQILQKLLGKDTDSQNILNAALLCAPKRVVVKRPKGSHPLSDLLPTMTLSSKNTRYDVYIAAARTIKKA